MSSFEGMDVGVVRRVSSGLQAQGQMLDHLISNIESTVGHAQQVWQGPDLAAFTHTWQSGLRSQLLAASSALHQMATSTSENADQQEGASARAIETLGSSGASAHVAQSDGRGYLTAGGVLHDVTEFFVGDDALAAAKLLHKVGVPLAGLSLGFAGVDLAEGMRDQDAGKVIVGGVDAVSAFFAPASALSMFANYTMPVSHEAQTGLLEYQAQRMFGTGLEQLSSSQADSLNDHYAGAMGPLNMISDKMDESWDKSVGKLFPGLRSVY